MNVPPDHHFIIDRHPEAGNAWIAGGGSGHGFKHGPAVGEIVARAVLNDRAPDPLFSLTRPGRNPAASSGRTGSSDEGGIA